MLKAIHHKALYLMAAAAIVLVLFSTPSAPAYADCVPISPPVCAG